MVLILAIAPAAVDVNPHQCPLCGYADFRSCDCLVPQLSGGKKLIHIEASPNGGQSVFEKLWAQQKKGPDGWDKYYRKIDAARRAAARAFQDRLQQDMGTLLGNSTGTVQGKEVTEITIADIRAEIKSHDDRVDAVRYGMFLQTLTRWQRFKYFFTSRYWKLRALLISLYRKYL